MGTVNKSCFRNRALVKAIFEAQKCSGKEEAHKHKKKIPVTARVGGGVLPTGWPGVKSLCAVCGTQGI